MFSNKTTFTCIRSFQEKDLTYLTFIIFPVNMYKRKKIHSLKGTVENSHIQSGSRKKSGKADYIWREIILSEMISN